MEIGTEVWVRRGREVWACGEVVDCAPLALGAVRVQVKLADRDELVTRAYRIVC